MQIRIAAGHWLHKLERQEGEDEEVELYDEHHGGDSGGLTGEAQDTAAVHRGAARKPDPQHALGKGSAEQLMAQLASGELERARGWPFVRRFEFLVELSEAAAALSRRIRAHDGPRAAALAELSIKAQLAVVGVLEREPTLLNDSNVAFAGAGMHNGTARGAAAGWRGALGRGKGSMAQRKKEEDAYVVGRKEGEIGAFERIWPVFERAVETEQKALIACTSIQESHELTLWRPLPLLARHARASPLRALILMPFVAAFNAVLFAVFALVPPLYPVARQAAAAWARSSQQVLGSMRWRAEHCMHAVPRMWAGLFPKSWFTASLCPQCYFHVMIAC